MRFHLCSSSGWQGQAGDDVLIAELARRLLFIEVGIESLTVSQLHVRFLFD